VSDGVISAEDRKKGGPAVSVWLPAGEVFLTPVPGTANGVVVADHMYQGDRIEGLRLGVKNGKMVGMTAGTAVAGR
jgi:leucyl aminopeptidase (aminopeptidase T)